MQSSPSVIPKHRPSQRENDNKDFVTRIIHTPTNGAGGLGTEAKSQPASMYPRRQLLGVGCGSMCLCVCEYVCLVPYII